tara:strand:+ start:119 stop:532 length:414 start_codon:yes stop_codon:yes gene_type:complete
MAEIQDITKDNFDSAVLASKGLLMVYYHAPWCKPCGEMKETLDTVADEVAEKMGVVQVNTDQEEEIITQQKIRSIPTFQVFKDGNPIERFQGTLSKLELLGQLSNIITDGSDEADSETEGDSESAKDGEAPEEASEE